MIIPRSLFTDLHTRDIHLIMRMSCNGCRVLRKGCSEFCVLRPCLHWIRTAESQRNATIFLAKFYGRAGLTNLITRAPEQLRPDIFRSLLSDACGRMVNPIYGSLGLLLSGNWAECQAGVDSILRGSFPAFTRGNFVSSDRKVLLPTEGMAGSERHRSKKGRGRGSSRSKPKHKQDETVPIFNHYGSSSESDDWDSEKEIGNGEFNGEYVETYSTFQAGQEHDEFVAAQQQMECRHDLICNLKSSEPETPACNAVELELTLGSQSSCSPPTPRKVSALDISWNEARWDHCMLETYLP